MLLGRLHEPDLEVALVAVHRPHPDLDEDGQHVLQQRAVGPLAGALSRDRGQQRLSRGLPHLGVHLVAEPEQPHLRQGVHRVPRDVVPVEVVEEARQPAHHQLVVGPARPQLAQQELARVAAEGRQHAVRDVGGEGVAVAGVELGGVVVRGLLGAHAVEREREREFLVLFFFEGRRRGRKSVSGRVSSFSPFSLVLLRLVDEAEMH